MFKKGMYGIAVAAMMFCRQPTNFTAQGQSDPQAGAQTGEQSALAGKQNQAANTQKTEKSASGETSLAAGTTIAAELTNSLDSKKVKQGDAVNARASETLKSADGTGYCAERRKVDRTRDPGFGAQRGASRIRRSG